MIEKHNTNSFIFRETEVNERDKGNENFRFYYKYLKRFLKKMMEKSKNEI